MKGRFVLLPGCVLLAAGLASLVLAGCERASAPAAVSFHAQGKPALLSEWHVLRSDGARLETNQGVEPYTLNATLFSDYAHKLRTIWMPPGAKAKYDAQDAFDFPVGTIISKTFYYPRAGGDGAVMQVAQDDGEGVGGLDLSKVRLLETRLLVRRAEGWVAMPYVWNEEQTDAALARAGETIALQMRRPDDGNTEFAYMVPDENQCAGCHATDNTTRAIQPIGPRARHLNRDDPWHPGENQLARMGASGRLEGLPAADVPRNARLDDATASVEARARAYLDINCGHCHSPQGPADTSGLWLDAATEDPIRLGLCKPPVAAGQGTGDHSFDIVPGRPDESILVYRMESLDPGAMMPEVGRATVHAEGAAVVRDWIRAWLGSCSAEPAAIEASRRGATAS